MLFPFDLTIYINLSNRCCADSTHHAGVERYHIGNNTVNPFSFLCISSISVSHVNTAIVDLWHPSVLILINREAFPICKLLCSQDFASYERQIVMSTIVYKWDRFMKWCFVHNFWFWCVQLYVWHHTKFISFYMLKS